MHLLIYMGIKESYSITYTVVVDYLITDFLYFSGGEFVYIESEGEGE